MVDDDGTRLMTSPSAMVMFHRLEASMPGTMTFSSVVSVILVARQGECWPNVLCLHRPQAASTPLLHFYERDGSREDGRNSEGARRDVVL